MDKMIDAVRRSNTKMPPLMNSTFNFSIIGRAERVDGFVIKNSHSIKIWKYPLRAVKVRMAVVLLRCICGESAIWVDYFNLFNFVFTGLKNGKPAGS